ncbi:hypothetical protein C8R45DRAFT_945994 [Mycena sanguinolenta]|nr:hypothetical protein C8R45DRAFT_945994 [Mycena sanguinolenta]
MPPPSNSEVAWARAAVKQFGSSSPTGVDTGVRMRHPLVAADRPAKGSHQGLGGKYLNCSVSRGGGMARTLRAALSSAEVSSARAVDRRCRRIERGEATSDDERDNGRDDERDNGRDDERDNGRDDERGRRRPRGAGDVAQAAMSGTARRWDGGGETVVERASGEAVRSVGCTNGGQRSAQRPQGTAAGASSSTSDAAAAAVSSTSRDRVGATRAQDRADVARPSVEGASAEGRRGVLEHAVVPRWGVERADATAMSGTSTVRIEGGDERGGEPEIAGEQRASGNGGADVAPATARVRRRWRRARERERERGDGRGDVESAAACSHFETALEAGVGRVQAGATACVLGRRSGVVDSAKKGGGQCAARAPSAKPKKFDHGITKLLQRRNAALIWLANSGCDDGGATTAGIITNGDVGNSGLSREDAAHRRMWSSHVGTAPSGTASWSMYQVLV